MPSAFERPDCNVCAFTKAIGASTPFSRNATTSVVAFLVFVLVKIFRDLRHLQRPAASFHPCDTLPTGTCSPSTRPCAESAASLPTLLSSLPCDRSGITRPFCGISLPSPPEHRPPFLPGQYALRPLSGGEAPPGQRDSSLSPLAMKERPHDHGTASSPLQLFFVEKACRHQ